MSEVVADLRSELRLDSNKASFAAGDRLISGIKKGMGLLAGLSAVKWFGGVIEGVVSTADHVDELSQSTGVGVEALQALGHAGKFSSLSIDQMAQSMGFLQKNAEAAAGGSKKQAKAFRDIGVDADALANGSLSLEDALGTIADKFAGMHGGAVKSNLAIKLFGKSGRQMIPFLNAGSAGIKKLTDEARELGIVLDQDTITSMAQLDDQQTSLSAAWQGLKNDIAVALLPTLLDVTKGLLAWFKANRKLISQKIGAFFRIVAAAARTVYNIVSKVVQVFEWLADKLGLAGDQVGELIGVLYVLAKVSGIAGAALSGGFASGLLPIILLAAAIAGRIALIGDVSFDDIRNKVEDFLGWARDKAESIAPGSTHMAAGAAQAVGAILTGGEIAPIPQSVKAFHDAIDRGRDGTDPVEAKRRKDARHRRMARVEMQDTVDALTGHNDTVVRTAIDPTDTTVSAPSADLQALWASGGHAAPKVVTVTSAPTFNIYGATDPDAVAKIMDGKIDENNRNLADQIVDAHDGGTP